MLRYLLVHESTEAIFNRENSLAFWDLLNIQVGPARCSKVFVLLMFYLKNIYTSRLMHCINIFQAAIS